MADGVVLKALKSHTKKLSLDNSQLDVLPTSLGRLTLLEVLSAKNNRLNALPDELVNLQHLTYLNISSNKLACIPTCITALNRLQTLHLFNNHITTLPNNLPRSLVVLNLNGNYLTSVPAGLNQLCSLQTLSLSNNVLSSIPNEISSLHSLIELHLNDNNLELLPADIGKLLNLKKLLLQKNSLRHLPSSIGSCRRLKILDASSNELELFPSEIQKLSLEELHYENNPLLPYIPVPAEQVQEVMPLKEVTSRLIVADNELRSAVACHYPQLQDQLDSAGCCALCGGPFVSLWLDCVQFELPKKVFKKVQSCTLGHIPLRAQLCSYKCFNSEGHKLYGIAQPPTE